ncbi:hypothetical protein [Natrinema sp. DC36]|uniref:hypothetical protein n=1 Tax=Natrinema sp. DC36 TaxID=2878680 RepID=UPI001CF0BCEB|nr:hypothetical protein [Natrinema sp. DC36]
MRDFERLKAAIIDELEREPHTHKSLRQTISDEHDCSENDVSQAISALHDAGVIEHEQGFFVHATD